MNHIISRLGGLLTALTLLLGGQPTLRAEVYTLDSCRTMALQNNRLMRIKAEEIRKAGYQKRQAFAAYLPAFDFNALYAWNQRDISVFDSDQLLPVKNFNLATQSYEFDIVTNPMTGQPVTGPDGQPVPQQVALIPKDAMTYDMSTVFFGAVTLTQPIFMGGKIVAMNKIAGYAEEAARELHTLEAQNMLYAVDAAYWQVVSLRNKHELAQAYVALLDTLQSNVRAMLAEGVATRSDLLQVEVKLNSANFDLVRVENGLALSRMALAQVCGLPIDSQMTTADELESSPQTLDLPQLDYTMEEVYATRPDLRALEVAARVAEQEAVVARSDMLPKLALMGAYAFSTPNIYNGFSKTVKGGFTVGATLSVPLWHWGGNYNKYRAAQADATVARLKIEEAREKVSLQVSQAAFKATEALKTLRMTEANIASAEQNLSNATLGYDEGVMTLTTVMEAQTAWLKACSEKIDAEIDVRLCDVYLSKVLGTLTVE